MYIERIFHNYFSYQAYHYDIQCQILFTLTFVNTRHRSFIYDWKILQFSRPLVVMFPKLNTLGQKSQLKLWPPTLLFETAHEWVGSVKHFIIYPVPKYTYTNQRYHDSEGLVYNILMFLVFPHINILWRRYPRRIARVFYSSRILYPTPTSFRNSVINSTWMCQCDGIKSSV